MGSETRRHSFGGDAHGGKCANKKYIYTGVYMFIYISPEVTVELVGKYDGKFCHALIP